MTPSPSVKTSKLEFDADELPTKAQTSKELESPSVLVPRKPSIELVQVPKSDIDRVSIEAQMLKELVPMVVNNFYVSSVCKVPALEARLSEVKRERDRELARFETAHRTSDMLKLDLEQEKKENSTFKVKKNNATFFLSLSSIFLVPE